MLVIVARYGAVSSFVFVFSVRTNEYAGHHSERAECGRYHVAHHVAIIVLTSPDVATLAADYACNSVVDQGVEVL